MEFQRCIFQHTQLQASNSPMGRRHNMLEDKLERAQQEQPRQLFSHRGVPQQLAHK